MRAVISAVPMVGGPAVELFGAIVPASLERRRTRWFELVDERLRALEVWGVDLTAAAADEGFITIVVETTKLALSTHLEQKLEMLAGVIESVALDVDRDSFLTKRWLHEVDQLEPEHFAVMAKAYRTQGMVQFDDNNRPSDLDRFVIGDITGVLPEAILMHVHGDLTQMGLATTGSWGPNFDCRYLKMSNHAIELLDFVRLISQTDEGDP